jgi:hypothetical protein
MVAALLAVSALSAGCASQSYHVRIDVPGEYRDTTATVEAAEDMPAAKAQDVRVLLGTLPPGLEVHEGNVVVTDPSRVQLLGFVGADAKNGGLAPFSFYNYPEDEAWRRPYCYAQAPLTWITAMLWSVLPFDYPCWVAETEAPADVGARKRRIVQTLQRATKALGGNAVVVESLGDTVFVHKGTEKVLGQESMTLGRGWALKITGADVPAAAPPAPTATSMP